MFDDYDVEENEANDDFSEDHLDSLKEVGIGCLGNFFQNKRMYCGGNVSGALLKSARVINRLLTTDVIEGVDRAYVSLSMGGFCRGKSKNGVRKDTQLILDILNECSELKIPKCFRGGILLLYIELCYGIKIY